jgi:hypothetical protein
MPISFCSFNLHTVAKAVVPRVIPMPALGIEKSLLTNTQWILSTPKKEVKKKELAFLSRQMLLRWAQS